MQTMFNCRLACSNRFHGHTREQLNTNNIFLPEEDSRHYQKHQSIRNEPGSLIANPTPSIVVIVPGSDAITYRIVISGNIEVIPLKQYKYGFNYYINPGDSVWFSHYKPVGLDSQSKQKATAELSHQGLHLRDSSTSRLECSPSLSHTIRRHWCRTPPRILHFAKLSPRTRQIHITICMQAQWMHRYKIIAKER